MLLREGLGALVSLEAESFLGVTGQGGLEVGDTLLEGHSSESGSSHTEARKFFILGSVEGEGQALLISGHS